MADVSNVYYRKVQETKQLAHMNYMSSSSESYDKPRERIYHGYLP
jgi:hypothetical protein